LTPTSGNPPSGGEEGPNHIRENLPAQLRKRNTRQLQPPWHYHRKPSVLRPPTESAEPPPGHQVLEGRDVSRADGDIKFWRAVR
jgi:hypothetical protein